MSKLINTYPVFENSQVLTSSQLNQVVSYLDQQSRLTRVKLIGMGIVCGLEITYEKTGTDSQIIISKGTAITSEGFLVTLGHCDTSWYRPYTLPEGVTYKPFEDHAEEIVLYELLKEQPKDGTGIELHNSEEFLDHKFVLLFLEIFDNDLKSCLGNTCDELGIDRIFTVRKLLISKEHLDLMLKHSGNVGQIYPDYSDKYELPDIVMPRILFDANDDHSKNLSDFTNHHIAAIQPVFSALFGEKNGDDDERSPGALYQTYSVYDLLLEPEYDLQNPFGTEEMYSRINELESYLEGASNDKLGIQYFSDFLKDLILAYDEFRETAFDLMAECCPDMSLFPKHVMLGQVLVPGETSDETHTYRHGFTQPPIYNHQKQLIAITIALHKRMVLMVGTFNLDRINNPKIEGEDQQQPRITPSNEKNPPLSERSIPYYYDSKVKVAIVGEGTLEQHWNFDITRKKPPATSELVLSYENQLKYPADIMSPLKTPLFYDLDAYPFLRIEGHIGHEYEGVIEKINKIKSKFDLPFDTVALQLDPNADQLELDYSCGFEDLQEEFIVAKSILCKFVRDFGLLHKYIEDNNEKYFNDAEERTRYFDLLDKPLQVIIDLCKSLPDCINKLKFEEFHEGYKALQQLIIYFNLLDATLLENMNTNNPASLYETFLRIYYGFKRREYYLQRETAVFSSYISQHPGMQHQAGVPKGGTFIMVYNNSEDQVVIADFNIPYLCCATENCVPMCDEEDSKFEFDIPPLARPDFAITTVNTAVDIHVTINDYDFLNNELFIDNVTDTSENGGSIYPIAEGVLLYTPKEGFTGFDTFPYRLNSKTGEDTGTVTVLVKEQAEETGCYSAKILDCWGIDLMNLALETGGVNVTGWSNQQIFDTLLQNLRRDKGFRREVLTKLPLENKKKLLDCLNISYAEEPTNFELERLIREYENKHCGEQEVPCTVTEVTGIVIDRSGDEIPGVTILVKGTTHGTATNDDGRFSLELDEPGQTLVISSIGFQTQNVEVCNEPGLEIVLQKSRIESQGVFIIPDLISTAEVVNILDARSTTIEDTDDRELVLHTLTSRERGNTFSQEELQLLKNDTLKKILDEKKISFNVNDTKDVLIRKLMKG